MSQYMNYMPPHQIILGQPYYGRRGCVANLTDAHQVPTNVATPTYLIAATHDSNGVVTNFSSHRDPGDGVSEWDTWTDTNPACNREQYFDDVVSLGAKYDLVNKDDLEGVGFFTLDYAGGAPEVWNAIATHFTLIPGLVGNLSACAANASAAVSWTAAPTCGRSDHQLPGDSQPGRGERDRTRDRHFRHRDRPHTGDRVHLHGGRDQQQRSRCGRDHRFGDADRRRPRVHELPQLVDKASPGMLNDNVHILNSGLRPAQAA